MKKAIKSFTTFTRLEWRGLIALCFIIIILLIIRFTMHLWVHPAIDKVKERKLVAAWEAYKAAEPAYEILNQNDSIENEYHDAFDENPNPLPAIVNINIVDSATLVRFKGIGPKTASKIINYRKSKGCFTNVNQLNEMHLLSKATFERLKIHFVIDSIMKH